jgi:hypothetical protein
MEYLASNVGQILKLAPYTSQAINQCHHLRNHPIPNKPPFSVKIKI